MSKIDEFNKLQSRLAPLLSADEFFIEADTKANQVTINVLGQITYYSNGPGFAICIKNAIKPYIKEILANAKQEAQSQINEAHQEVIKEYESFVKENAMKIIKKLSDMHEIMTIYKDAMIIKGPIQLMVSLDSIYSNVYLQSGIEEIRVRNDFEDKVQFSIKGGGSIFAKYPFGINLKDGILWIYLTPNIKD